MLSELQAQQVKIVARHTDLQNANDSLRHTSRHDGLTQLPNRAYLVEHLNAVISRCLQDDTRAAAPFVDVDKFKAVNDQHGHEAGDELLRELARRLLASVRASDFVARFGGDEFIVVMSPLSDAHEVGRCVERIRGAIAPGLTLPNCTQLRMSVIIGSAICPVDAQDLDGLIRAADAAMYEAKTRDRGSFAAYERP